MRSGQFTPLQASDRVYLPGTDYVPFLLRTIIFFEKIRVILLPSWDFFLVDFLVPWRTRRSWRRRHRTRTKLSSNKQPGWIGWWFSTETSYRFLPKSRRFPDHLFKIPSHLEYNSYFNVLWIFLLLSRWQLKQWRPLKMSKRHIWDLIWGVLSVQLFSAVYKVSSSHPGA